MTATTLMTRQTRSSDLIPDKTTLNYIGGEAFIKVREAAKLAGLHPAIVEMGQRLLKKPGQEAGVFTLGTTELQNKAEAIRGAFVKGLRRMAKVLGPAGLTLRATHADGRLTFWYQVGRRLPKGGKKKGAAA